MKTKELKHMNPRGTIAEFKTKKLAKKHIDFEKPIGRFNVGLLKELIKSAKLRKSDCIGVYVTKTAKGGRVKKGDLSLLHCKGWLMAPMKYDINDDWKEGLS